MKTKHFYPHSSDGKRAFRHRPQGGESTPYTNRIPDHLRSRQGDHPYRGFEADFSRFETNWQQP